VTAFDKVGHALLWRRAGETLKLQPWGRDAIRVQATRESELLDQDWALLPPDPAASGGMEIGDSGASLRNGSIRAEISSAGRIRFLKEPGAMPLLEEVAPDFIIPPARDLRALPGGGWRAHVTFLAPRAERVYGLGQHANGFLDQKGCVIDLEQRNTQVSIPFYLSSLGYGFLWNNPAVGRVELGRDYTRWVAGATRQVDYWIAAGDSPAGIMERYADATGHPPQLPRWAAGFWQCKLRYRSQEELLSVAREYRRRGLPLSVIVIDFFHWTAMGDWRFDPAQWPDPGAMVRELDSLGVHVMVSVWPAVNRNSANYTEMAGRGLLARSVRGMPVHLLFRDGPWPAETPLQYYDPTSPEARRFIWEQIREGYYRHGIKVFWLDACEPEIYPDDHDNMRYHLGPGLEVANIYPWFHQRAFYDGMTGEGEDQLVLLCRSAWAGSQRYGAAVWSGDIFSTFESLQAQVRAGLNIGMSGIPWWTTDIGGFRGGDPRTEYFRELIVRWFQYGVFCPLFRLHGVRDPYDNALGTGAPNEIWSFGERAYGIIRDLLALRERMGPYLLEQMHVASAHGTPSMRPLFFDFPDDEAAWHVEDQFMLGPDVLVAPVLEQGQNRRRLYLPGGTSWEEARAGRRHAGGDWIEVDAPLESVPFVFRSGRHPF
jgi:alpha-D-xyloside xylohydrolase